jgi:predicted transcriptional regulator
MKAPSEKAPFDWIKGQEMFESGVCSLNQIARTLGCSDSAVSQRASRYGWTRDPAAVARLADERARLLSLSSKEERDKVIAVTASMQSQVLVGHRKDIARSRRVVSVLLDELGSISDPASQDALDHLGDLLAEPDENGKLDKLNKVYRRVISMSERIAGINALSTALKTLIMLERQAFNIEGALVDPTAERPQEDVVKGLDKIMDKFNQVLALQAPQEPVSAPTTLVIIEDVNVSRPHQAPATARAV